MSVAEWEKAKREVPPPTPTQPQAATVSWADFTARYVPFAPASPIGACADALKRVTFERDRLTSHVPANILAIIERIDARQPNQRCADGCESFEDEAVCFHCGHATPAGPIQYARFARLRHALLWAGIIGWGPLCAAVTEFAHWAGWIHR